MTYAEAITKIFAAGTIPDGYFGETADVQFAFDAESGVTVVVTPTGFFRASIPPAVDTDEALWLLRNHPRSNARNVTAQIENEPYTLVGSAEAIREFEARFGYKLRTITKAEWDARHADYKGISSDWNIDKGIPAGLPSVLVYDNGTCLEWVRVIA
jgi:hypothetical protein